MKSTVKGAVVLAALPTMFGLCYAQEKIAHLSTLEWPPYTSDKLPLGGATTEVVREAFSHENYKIAVSFQSWKRAIDMAAKKTEDVVAYFPGYHCKHRDGFIASEQIGSGPLGFAEHIEAPITWDNLDSIIEQQLKIGTVRGYANTDEFDAKVGTGWIFAVPSDDDVSNLEKLIRKRIDAAVIDKFVLEYLKATEETIMRDRDKLRFNKRPLEDKTLYLCFRDDETGRAMRQIFNTGLAKVKVEKIVASYFSKALSE